MERRVRFAVRPDGQRIAYTVYGKGPPLIRAPGNSGHIEIEWAHRVFREANELLAAERTIIRCDRHGGGLSDRDRKDFTWHNDVVDIETLMKELGLEKAPIMGVSGGGPGVIAFVATHPERISRLILCGTVAKVEEHYPMFATYIALRELRMANPALAQRTFTEMLYPRGISPDILAVNERLAASVSPEVREGQSKEFLSVDVTRLAAQIQAPTLVMHRRGDQTVSFEAGRDLAFLIPNARFVPLEGDAHLDLGEDFVTEALSFLREGDPQDIVVKPAGAE